MTREDVRDAFMGAVCYTLGLWSAGWIAEPRPVFYAVAFFVGSLAFKWAFLWLDRKDDA